MKTAMLTDEEWAMVLEALGYACDENWIPHRYVELQDKLKAILDAQKES